MLYRALMLAHKSGVMSIKSLRYVQQWPEVLIDYGLVLGSGLGLYIRLMCHWRLELVQTWSD